MENASLRSERDEMEKMGVALIGELRETRGALVEAKAVGPDRNPGPASRTIVFRKLCTTSDVYTCIEREYFGLLS